ncbi:hypothetical protein Poly24_01590 [Rosistilla carotiformis]|uniref:TadE-like protein n=1 Tax=Rosistilla carotiformis TaxID=2528017 RepID=A0A518JLQ2_9BACT|nr:hypothetical protein [Rosistilla carotiformis]QDV66473.1 hypothetical protein Poly24_01590 [Rosistilla carotiformis]
MTLPMLLESVESVWVIWSVSLVALIALTRHAFLQNRWQGIRAFLRDESGASYTLPYLLTLPFAMLIFCCALQGTFILLAKIGTMHAAYGAARAAIVWQGAQWNSDSQSREHVDYYADRAAALGMVPFAAGVKQPQVERLLTSQLPSAGGANLILQSPLYNLAYQGFAGISESSTPSRVIRNPDAIATTSYINQKILVAGTLTKATVKNSNDITRFNDQVEVQVAYWMPLQIPLGAPIFAMWGSGPAEGNFYARRITTTVTLPSEAALTRSGRLEVPYVPHDI